MGCSWMGSSCGVRSRCLCLAGFCYEWGEMLHSLHILHIDMRPILSIPRLALQASEDSKCYIARAMKESFGMAATKLGTDDPSEMGKCE